MLRLPQKLRYLAPKLFKLLDWDRHADPSILLSEQLKVHFRTEHTIVVVRGNDDVDFPLHADKAEGLSSHCHRVVRLLSHLCQLICIVRKQAHLGEVLRVHQVHFRLQRLLDLLVEPESID